MIRATLLLAALLAALSCATAQASTLPAYPFVSTAGKAQVWLKPDIAELQFETDAQHPSAESAQAALAERSDAIAQLLAEHGIAQEDVDSAELARKSVSLSEPTPEGATTAWLLTRHFRVQVHDLQQWAALIAALLARDHVDALSVSFDRSDSDQQNRDLMAQAAQDARGNASLLAQSFGRKLGPAMAIARGPLDKVAAPFLEQAGNGDRPPRAPVTPGYAVPPTIPFAQAVTAVFRLR